MPSRERRVRELHDIRLPAHGRLSTLSFVWFVWFVDEYFFVYFVVLIPYSRSSSLTPVFERVRSSTVFMITAQ
jgi:hypothetical protein